MWNFKENKDLIGVAFIDTEIYIHRAVCIKNFILIVDITRSIQLLRYQVSHVLIFFFLNHLLCIGLQENRRTLSQISKDQFPSEIYACDFMIDGQQLGFISKPNSVQLYTFYEMTIPWLKY